MFKDVKRVVLAYPGGLGTSITLKWLQDQTHREVVTFTANIGQGEEIEPACAKAVKMGIKPENIFIEYLREEIINDPVRFELAGWALRPGMKLVAPCCNTGG
jgi:argininosuccinate synthase